MTVIWYHIPIPFFPQSIHFLTFYFSPPSLSPPFPHFNLPCLLPSLSLAPSPSSRSAPSFPLYLEWQRVSWEQNDYIILHIARELVQLSTNGLCKCLQRLDNVCHHPPKNQNQYGSLVTCTDSPAHEKRTLCFEQHFFTCSEIWELQEEGKTYYSCMTASYSDLEACLTAIPRDLVVFSRTCFWL